MATGKIKIFFDEKGFGFIRGADGQEFFVHINNIPGRVAPEKGASVSFEIRPGKKGLEAYDVKITGRGDSSVGRPHKPAPKASAPGPRGSVQDAYSTGPRGDFPYEFIKRKPGKASMEAFHHRQEENRLDIAFDVTWSIETPTALQPCEDPAVSESAVGNKGENTGYNKRWLMIGGKPAISPFTVKGAVANAFANLLGGCFRVPDREEGHNKSLDASTYAYTGKWKRYRVSMNGKSLPGIIREINFETGYVKVQPVNEYYWDNQNLPLPLKPCETCHAHWNPIKHKNIIDRLSQQGANGLTEGPVIYYGPYSFGMNLSLKPGDMGKRHYHRFYSKRGGEIEGRVPLLSLAPEKDLLAKVSGGKYCKDDPKELKVQHMRHHLGKPWYEDLRSLKPGDWCYYTAFEDEKGALKIAAIGKNFQFKALFNHEDTVPEGNKPCTDPQNLCPRCALFGIAGKDEGKDTEAVGYAGRFKASTLIADIKLTETKVQGSIPAKESHPIKVQFSVWKDGERVVIRQLALPVMGPPKPSKRDMNGYFEETTGEIKGAKRYLHADMDFDKTLDALIRETDRKRDTEEGMPYAHQMRPVSALCREGVAFSGTIGAENCSNQEIAGLLAILDKRSAGHAFKLGLGKNIGLGSVSPRIDNLWVRRPGEKWQSVKVPATQDSRKELFAALKGLIPEAVEALKGIINDKTAHARLHDISQKASSLEYAKAGQFYWKDAKVETIP